MGGDRGESGGETFPICIGKSVSTIFQWSRSTCCRHVSFWIRRISAVFVEAIVFGSFVLVFVFFFKFMFMFAEAFACVERRFILWEISCDSACWWNFISLMYKRSWEQLLGVPLLPLLRAPHILCVCAFGFVANLLSAKVCCWVQLCFKHCKLCFCFPAKPCPLVFEFKPTYAHVSSFVRFSKSL